MFLPKPGGGLVPFDQVSDVEIEGPAVDQDPLPTEAPQSIPSPLLRPKYKRSQWQTLI